MEDLGNGLTIDLVKIPAGRFMMGWSDEQAQDGKGNQHEVNISYNFYMSKNEITQMQWRMIAEAKELKVSRDLNPTPSIFGSNALFPVESVSWLDVVEFCERLKKKTGKPYRLPSEAEWEYACSAGTTTAFAFGSISTQIANYHTIYFGGTPLGLEYRRQPVPVCSLGVANAWGLFDMHGNVGEWCQDAYSENYVGVPADGKAYEDKGNAKRVTRGGGWNSYHYDCRSRSRSLSPLDEKHSFIGFRIVVVMP
ncbi:MAG: formylglycine-generating enzyme family protein [Acidobacteria bacterium]|nr:formylglycine-generating enzyme family protein [Acidobacteriota bacterium]